MAGIHGSRGMEGWMDISRWFHDKPTSLLIQGFTEAWNPFSLFQILFTKVRNFSLCIIQCSWDIAYNSPHLYFVIFFNVVIPPNWKEKLLEYSFSPYWPYYDIAIMKWTEWSNVKPERKLLRITIPANRLPTNQLWPADDLCLAYAIFKTNITFFSVSLVANISLTSIFVFSEN